MVLAFIIGVMCGVFLIAIIAVAAASRNDDEYLDRHPHDDVMDALDRWKGDGR